MLLTVTDAGLNAEDAALIQGERLSPIASIIVSDTPITSELMQATALTGNVLTLNALAIDRLSAGATKIYGEIPPDTEFHVRSVGILLNDGTLFACTNYLPDSDGFYKGLGFSFSLWVLLSRRQSTDLRFEYVPLDIQTIATRIEQEARVELDLWLNTFLLSTVKHLSGLNAEIYRLTRKIDTVKNGDNL